MARTLTVAVIVDGEVIWSEDVESDVENVTLEGHDAARQAVQDVAFDIRAGVI